MSFEVAQVVILSWGTLISLGLYLYYTEENLRRKLRRRGDKDENIR